MLDRREAEGRRVAGDLTARRTLWHRQVERARGSRAADLSALSQLGLAGCVPRQGCAASLHRRQSSEDRARTILQADPRGRHDRAALPYWMFSAPVGPQWLAYQAEQERFARAVTPEVRQALRLRLTSEDYGWNERERWRELRQPVAVDDYSGPIAERFRQCRMIIATANGTVPLESLGLDVPTVIFWNPAHWGIARECAAIHRRAARRRNLSRDAGIRGPSGRS